MCSLLVQPIDPILSIQLFFGQVKIVRHFQYVRIRTKQDNEYDHWKHVRYSFIEFKASLKIDMIRTINYYRSI
jgi:hypothetical protein